MTMPTQEAQRSRETAMQAERHFWTTRLEALAKGWLAAKANISTTGYVDNCRDDAADLFALIAERTK